jgi:hypothetical protein
MVTLRIELLLPPRGLLPHQARPTVIGTAIDTGLIGPHVVLIDAHRHGRGR